jgi:peptidase E
LLPLRCNFLISQIEKALSVAAFTKFLQEHKLPTEILFVPSMPKWQDKTQKEVLKILAAFNEKGIIFEKFKCLDNDATENEVSQDLQSSPLVFLMGGDVKEQNKFLRKLNLKALLHDYQGVVMGMSAGALNMGPEVFYHGGKNQLQGLNLVPLYVEVHYGDLESRGTWYNQNQDRFGIADAGALVVMGEKILTFGEVVELRG